MQTSSAGTLRALATDARPASSAGGVSDRVVAALAAARDYLLAQQVAEGAWCAELEGDTILESEYVLTMVFLGRGDAPRVRKAAEYLRRHQRPEGGWSLFPGGPADVSGSVKAYFVLKLLGDDPEAPHMTRARRAILEGGGLDACNSYTKIYLAMFGQVPWDACPAIPPELILFPAWFPFNLYEMSAWSRAIVVPLSILWAQRPHVAVPPERGIQELRAARVEEVTDVTKFTGRRTIWTRFFALADRMLKVMERSPWKPFRRLALQHCEAWVRQHLVKSDGVGAIFPPIINTIIGFSALGIPADDPDLDGQIRELERLGIEEEETLRVQPCFSALWDTAQVLNVLLAAGVAPDDPRLLEGARWLLDHEVREVGDWRKKTRPVDPGGWYFEYANEWYPDCDDTAEVLLVLSQVRFPDPEDESRREAAVRRGVSWMLAMQNPDGGWAAFDRKCTKKFLTHVPFADHNAMLDPSCEDITGRTLEAFSALGIDRGTSTMRRAIRFLRRKQEVDGTWYGRWGANYLYGTWLAVTGLVAAGEDPDHERFRRAAEWIRHHQNPDGGWGETLASYDDPTLKGRGESTAAQTAWALLTLLALGDVESPAVRRGLAFLVEGQRPDGSWFDHHWTGTGFPRVFYLRYHLYATQFPLLALATYQHRVDASPRDAA